MTGSGAVGLEGSPVMRGLGPSGVSLPQQPRPTAAWVWLQAGKGARLGKVRIRQGGEGTEAEEGTSLGPRSWRPARSGRVGGWGGTAAIGGNSWRVRSGGSAQEGWGLPPAQGSPGTRQAATGGPLATKAYSSEFKKVLKPVQLSFVRCSGMFPLWRLLEIPG